MNVTLPIATSNSVGDPQPIIGRGDVAASIYGPPTTDNPCGAGGPVNRWECDIAAALRRGDADLAKSLQGARARINLAFGKLEPVFVPSDGQRVFWNMVARLEAGENTFIDAVTK